MSADRSLASLSFRAKLVKIFAWTFAVLSVLQIGLTGYLSFKPDEIVVTANGGDQAAVPILPIMMTLISGLNLLVVLGFILCALLWIYRAHSNLAERDIAMDYSARWTVGSYFVPFANLVVPYRAMRELFNRSHGEIPEHAHSSVDDVFAWWIAYITGLSLWFLLIFKFLFDMLTNIVFLTPAWMEFAMAGFSSFLLVVAAFMLVKLTSAITAAQIESNHVWNAFE